MTRSRSIPITFAVALTLAALLAPSASARPYLAGNNRGASPAAAGAPAVAHISPATPTNAGRILRGGLRPHGSTVVGDISLPAGPGTHTSFHWGDAGIGAAGMLALALIVVGFGFVVVARRERYPGAA
jgi:hypothetical protein